VVVEGNRKYQRHDEEQDQDAFVVRANNEQEEKADQQDHEFRGDDVGQNGADKEAVLTLKQGHAVRTVMADVKRMVNDPRLATCRTAESQRATQDALDLFKVYFQSVGFILR